MMDTEHCECGKNGDMKHMHCRKHMAVRALAAIIVLIFVFWCGFEFGEIRASIGGGYGYGYRMMQGGWGGNGFGNSVPGALTQ